MNGKVIKDKVKILRDPNLFVKYILPNRYFMFPYIQRLKVTFPFKRQ